MLVVTKDLDYVSDYQLDSACRPKDAKCIAGSTVIQMIFAVLEV